MADFLTRLIERSRGLAPQGQQGQRVEPLIAPLYATGPNTAPPDDAMDDGIDNASDADQGSYAAQSRRQASAPQTTEVPLAPRLGEIIAIAPSSMPRPDDNISIASSSQRREPTNENTPETKSEQVPVDGTQRAQLSYTPGIEPLYRSTTLKPPPPPADERPGLTATAVSQARHANQEPLVVRPQSVAHADESNARVSEATDDHAAPVIRVTIGRIDVRAVNAPAPPARRATPPVPKLSLDEYLRSRSGRK